MPWSLDSGATRNATLAIRIPQGILTPPGSAKGDSTFLGLGVGTITRARTRNPQMYSWNLSVQREVGWNSIARSQLHRQPRRASVFALHQPDAARSDVLAGPECAYTRDQLQAAVPNPFYGVITDPMATNLNGQTIQHVPPVAQHAAV